MRPGRTTAEIASVWPKAQEFGFPDEEAAFALQFGHGIGLAIWEKPVISRLVSLEHSHEIKPGMVFALETFWPSKDGWSAARIEEEIVVTETGHEVITRFPAEELLVAGAHYFTVNGPLPTTRENEAPPSQRVEEMVEASAETRRSGGHGLSCDLRHAETMAISVVMPALEMAQETGQAHVLAEERRRAASPRASRCSKSKPTRPLWKSRRPLTGFWRAVTAKIGDEIPVGQTIAWLVAPGEQPPTRNTNAVSVRPGDNRPRSLCPAAAPPAAAGALRTAAAADFSQGPQARQRTRCRLQPDPRDGSRTAPSLSEDVQAAASSKSQRRYRGLRYDGTAEPGGAADGRAHHTELDKRPALFPGAECGCRRAHRCAEETQQRKRSRFRANDYGFADRACWRACWRDTREMNASWTGDGIRANRGHQHQRGDGGERRRSRRGDPQANQKDIAAISTLRRELTERARAGRLRARRYRGRYIHTEQSGDVQASTRSARSSRRRSARFSPWAQSPMRGAGGRQAGHPADDDHDAFERSSRGGWGARRGISWRSGERHSLTGKLVVRPRLR